MARKLDFHGGESRALPSPAVEGKTVKMVIEMFF
jgi:hypothetical protein